MKRKSRNVKSVPPTAGEESSKWNGTYTWSVENFTKLEESELHSPEFEVGGYSWRLVLLPKGNGNQRTAGYVAVYLCFAEATYTPQRMCPKAKFRIQAVRNFNRGDLRSRLTTHVFTAQAPCRGPTKFLSLQELQSHQNEYLMNDTLTLRVNILIQKDNPGVISKAKTGFVGIKSSEETNLLSSFLQCLFHIKAFRKAVFQIPTLESDNLRKSSPLALQHLFYKLQYNSTSAKPWDLLDALDCDCTDEWLQYDIFEMHTMFFNKLDEEDESCSVGNCITELFMGTHTTHTESKNIQESKTCTEAYMEIPLDVFECNDIYASLEKHCQIDTLKTDNHSHKTSQRDVESKQLVRFDSFPSVLLLRLKRYHYSPDRNAVLKINSRYEFYDQLDLDYNDHILLSKNADRTIENKYKLHSVLVNGDLNDGGHQSAFIRSDRKWYKFDNEVVKAVYTKEAISGQFGDQNGTTSANFTAEFERVRKTAAVMLIYIRKSEWQRVMCEADEQSLPRAVRERFNNERIVKEKRRKEKEEAHAFVIISLAMESHFSEQIGVSHYFDLVDFSAVKRYRIHKKTPFEEFKEMVNKDFGIPKHHQRFWTWRLRTNKTIRVCKPLIEGTHDLNTVLDLRHFDETKPPRGQEKTALMPIRLFLESPRRYSPGMDGILHSIQQDEMLIFIKYYDPYLATLSYLGHMFMEITCPFHVIFEKAKKMAGLAPEEHVIGFEEVKHSPSIVCGELEPDSTPEQNLIIHGDIIIVQRIAAMSASAFPTVKNFLEFVL